MSMGNQIPNWSKTNCRDFSVKKSLFEYTVKNLKEEEISLEKYRGYDALLVVNTASLCGLTKTQYTGLEKLREQLQKLGKFEILGFPCSQFKNQEPGSADEIMQCVSQFNVKFPLFEKTFVNGPNSHEVFTFLKYNTPSFRTISGNTLYLEPIGWNFGKFLIDREGQVVQYYSPKTDPMSIENDATRVKQNLEEFFVDVMQNKLKGGTSPLPKIDSQFITQREYEPKP